MREDERRNGEKGGERGKAGDGEMEARGRK